MPLAPLLLVIGALWIAGNLALLAFLQLYTRAYPEKPLLPPQPDGLDR